MITENFRDIEEIYHAAVELPAGERRAFLEESCAGNEDLLAEVSSLLEHDEHEGFLESSPQALVAELIDRIGESPNLVGSTIGHFEIIELLGKGGMGEVYLAKDKKLGRSVALKFMPPEFVANTDRMNRFIREARTVSALNHPNIITIYDINEVEGKHFIAAEYIQGKTLRQFAGGERIEPVQAIEIAIQIASALDEAHSARIAHRDIKPDNIMIRPNGLVKILDFGIAKVGNELEPQNDLEPGEESGPPVASTRTGVILGTAEYVSPEQARGHDVDTRTDIFSFGIVLFEMLEGMTPFIRDTGFKTIEAILKEEPPVPSVKSPEIRRILTKCLAKDPADRYQTASDLVADLRIARRSVDARNARPTMEVEIAETRAVTERATNANEIAAGAEPFRASRRNTLIAAAGAVLAIVIGIVGYGYFARDQRPIRSIAVIPFSNVNGNPELEYLSDGLTESLIRRLSNIPDLSVKGRASAFVYKDQFPDIAAMGRELNVDAVLIGRLSQIDSDLTLRLELIETKTQGVIWTDSYRRSIPELAAFQGEIAIDVTEKLRSRLTSAQQERVAKVNTVNSDANLFYLRGRFHWNKRNVKDFQRAISYFEKAVAIDPDFALAHAGLADTLALMPLYGDFPPKEYMPRAKSAALKALELDENLAEAHASLGYIFTSYDYDWSSAERQYQLAIRLNPNYATARQWYAEHLAFRGRMDDALEQITAAYELDPLSLTINRMKGNILTFAGRYDEAQAQFEKAVEMYPDNALLRFNVGDLEAARGRPEQAVAEYLNALKLDGYDEKLLGELQESFRTRRASGFWKTYRDQMAAARNLVLDENPNAYFDNESVAFAYASNGDREKTIEFLNLAYESRNPSLTTVGNTHVYDFLRDDPRFIALMQKIGLGSR